MPERCTWCDKFPLLRVQVALVEADRTHYVCRECWPEDKWGKFPHDRERNDRCVDPGTEHSVSASENSTRTEGGESGQ